MTFNDVWTGFKDNTLDILKNHFWDVEGRVDLWEFWHWWVFVFIGNFLLNLISPILSGAFSLAMLAPSISIMTRRLHDLNKSGWVQLLHVIPGIGSLALLFICAIPGNDEDNNYGNPPPRKRFNP